MAAILLAVCGAVLLVADAAFRTRELDEDRILDTANTARAEGRPVIEEFIGLYAKVVESRRLTNRWRLALSFLVQVVALAAIGFVLWELIYSLDARLK